MTLILIRYGGSNLLLISMINKITTLLNLLYSNRFLDTVGRHLEFTDEPHMHCYAAKIKNIRRVSDGIHQKSNAGGYSFSSRELALLKCLVEAIERISSICYRNKNFLYKSFDDIETAAINPNLYHPTLKDPNPKLSWSQGFDFLTDSKCWIPSQLLYYSYRLRLGEPYLSVPISTGAAGGSDKFSAIARGIYEVIERDAFMTAYLTQSKAPLVDLIALLPQLSKKTQSQIKKIITAADQYNLEIKLFDITNDLNIPVFLTIVLDKTGMGPSVSVGAKASLLSETAILGSIEEGFHTRPWLKLRLLNAKEPHLNINPEDINDQFERGYYWTSISMIKHLKFLLDQIPTQIKINKTKLTSMQELEILKKIIKQKGFHAYFADITFPKFSNSGFVVYKAIIPELQPLYLREKSKEFREARLKTVSKFFGQDKYALNTIAHPFL